MHTIAPYTFRCYIGTHHKDKKLNYSNLDKIKGHYDLLLLLEKFIKERCDYTILEKTKQVYRFTDVKFNQSKREIYGWIESGFYGEKRDIINIDTGKVDYLKTQKNAEMIKYYFHFYIPLGVNEGMAFLQTYRKYGIKTLFYSQFFDYFKSITDLSLQMNPLAYEKALSDWLDAETKEIIITQFNGLHDIADQVNFGGHVEKSLCIKAPRSKSLGKLSSFLKKDTDNYKMIEVLSGFGSTVKTIVEIEGRTKRFNVKSESNNTISEIIFDEDDVSFIDGIPQLTSIYSWMNDIIKEYIQNLYRGLKVERT
ncbi:hypothetical protein [Morganella morganii]|uniref:hypothetical protein n=1 Tax=Morganella morganii TaxID=582 RepID=UPI00159F49D6|nr:hypothetical protein [Morganella morganii]QLB46459.1 hypothetical protein E7Y21_04615 [Morganella morganii]HDS7364672.1 hypothetical protein [Morganella morganii subsp. morganii]HEO9696033.1 hypothetical protein [Morganella morganii subsp. morganii]